MSRLSVLVGTALLCLSGQLAFGDDSTRLLTIDHYVKVRSMATSIAGQDAQLYVREVVVAGPALRTRAPSQPVVLFVHGAGTPAEVAFDSSPEGYSWMAHMARSGFDTFAVDMTGYGRSTRPAAMNDPCNVARESQAAFIPQVLKAPCPPSLSGPITTMESDWHDIDAVVDQLRVLRGVDKVSLVAWSQGGPRAGGYAARNPGKVNRLVVLAPAYQRSGPLNAPQPLLAAGAAPMTTQSQGEFMANWDRQVGCADQYETSAAAAIWADLRASDAVGSTWGSGVRRAPQVPTWGFNREVVAKMQTPFLMVVGSYDKQVPPERVRELYTDLGAKQKVFVELACSSHNAMWEKNRAQLFRVSTDWLRDGAVNGLTLGEFKLGE